MDGAKDEDLQTVVMCQKGREVPYQRFGRIADEIIILNKFKDMVSQKMQKQLRDTSTIVVPHRSLTAYLGYKALKIISKFQSSETVHCFKQKRA